MLTNNYVSKDCFPPPLDTKRPFTVGGPPDNYPPWWNKLYDRKAKAIDGAIWLNLMSPTNEVELLKVIGSLNEDSAPDIEGNSGGQLKFLFKENSTLSEVLVDMINHILLTGETPKDWNSHYISLIEKKQGQISKETLANDMRPISIINEYSKIVSKLLADRLGAILLIHDVVSPSQRAFLKNGSISIIVSPL